MIIRKKFEFDGSHIVRNCSSERCKRSIHAHTYEVEILFESTKLDNGFMVMDFGLTKSTIRDFVKSFDKSYTLWDRESDEFKEFVFKNYPRVVTIPVSPSAESYALLIYAYVQKIIENTVFSNNEGTISLHSVKVHETRTGYAEATAKDLESYPININDFVFSGAVQDKWAINFHLQLKVGTKWNNDVPDQQILNTESDNGNWN